VDLTCFRRALVWRWSLAVVYLALAGIAFGCGSGQEQGKKGDGSATKLLKDEDLYEYVGTGKAKHKEAISIRERAKRLREAEQKSQ
jgi:hypothetical protein